MRCSSVTAALIASGLGGSDLRILLLVELWNLLANRLRAFILGLVVGDQRLDALRLDKG